MEDKIQSTRYVAPQVSSLTYIPIATKLPHSLAHGWRMRGTNFQDDLLSRFPDTAEKVFCAPSIILFTNEQERDYKIWYHRSE
jgi:hypothetical protein